MTREQDARWALLHRVVEERRMVLGLRQSDVQALGGPSTAWLRKLKTMSGPPDLRSRRSMDGLDRVFRWPPGTTRRLLTEDVPATEVQYLIDFGDDGVEELLREIRERLRTMAPDEARDAMRAIRDLL